MVHVPVLCAEVVQALQPEHGGLFVDCTVGLGGHSAALLRAGASRILGLDRDAEALEQARLHLAQWGDRVALVHADYREIDAMLDARGIGSIDGALADLGVSSLQLGTPDRGFSFSHDAPLDMRMDPSRGEPVATLLARASEPELADVIFQFGEERFARRIARAIVRARGAQPIERTAQLADVVRRAVPRRGYTRIDPATRTFQALRIWVNRELEGLDRFLAAVVRRLRVGARLAVIAFHSLEDRVVKHTLRDLASTHPLRDLAPRPTLRDGASQGALVRLVTKRPIEAGDEEVQRNPRSRSAKLRVAERITPANGEAGPGE
jgi:16S rRNA (cytosine1402-N4)-methyltransferase